MNTIHIYFNMAAFQNYANCRYCIIFCITLLWKYANLFNSCIFPYSYSSGLRQLSSRYSLYKTPVEICQHFQFFHICTLQNTLLQNYANRASRIRSARLVRPFEKNLDLTIIGPIKTLKIQGFIPAAAL